MLRLMESKHYQILFNLNFKFINSDLISMKGSSSSQENNYTTANTLELLLYMCSAIINDEIYPLDWSELLLLRDKVVLNALNNIADCISNHYLNNFNSLNKKIWQNYFEAIVSLLTDPCLQMENFSETKRKNILQKYGDI
jgi:hypothetical protein